VHALAPERVFDLLADLQRDALDERRALEDLGIAALGRQATRLAERRPEVAHDIPADSAL